MDCSHRVHTNPYQPIPTQHTRTYLIGERAGLAEHEVVADVDAEREEARHGDADHALGGVLVVREGVQVVEERAHDQHALRGEYCVGE